VEQRGDECVFRVRDTGVRHRPRTAAPHLRSVHGKRSGSLDRSQGGLGIGLALVQTVGGNATGVGVEAISALGHGSEFIVRLPVVAVSGPAPQLALTPEPIEASGPSLRILVVDDNVDSAESLAMLLRTSRHNVRTAHDGPTAVAAALAFRPNVVLLDIGLPGLDGYEVAKRIRREPSLRKPCWWP